MFLRKISDFLQQDLDADLDADAHRQDQTSRQAVIDYFRESEGVCNGAAVLWAYGRYINEDKLTDHNKPKDDIHFFNRIYNLIVEWDGATPFSASEKHDIYRFISNLTHYQHDHDIVAPKEFEFKERLDYYDQQRLEDLMEDTKRGCPTASYNLDGCICTKEMFAEHMEKIMQPDVMVLLKLYIADRKNDRHLASVFQSSHDHCIYYFDINNGRENSSYEKVVKDFRELANEVWESSRPDIFNPMHGRPIGMAAATREIGVKIYSFTPHPVKMITDDKMNISDQEIQSVLQDHSYYFTKLPPDRLATQLLLSLNEWQMLSLLDNKETDDKIKKVLIFAIIKNQTSFDSILLSRFLLSHHQEMIRELIHDGHVPASYLKDLEERATRYMMWPSKLVKEIGHTRAENETVQSFLRAIDNGTFNDNIQLLNINEAMELTAHRPGDRDLITKLLTRCDPHRPPPLMAAQFISHINAQLNAGHVEAAKYMVELMRRRHGFLPDYFVIQMLGNIDIARFIHEKFDPGKEMEACIKAISEDQQPHNLMRKAVRLDDVTTLQHLVQQHPNVSLDMSFDQGVTLAHEAAQHRSTKVLKFLADRGANFYAVDAKGETPFSTMIAQGYRVSPELLQTVSVVLNADVNKELLQDKKNYIHLAVQKGRRELIPLLVAHGFNINQGNVDDAPPLWIAATTAAFSSNQDKILMIDTLLQQGANLQSALEYGKNIPQSKTFWLTTDAIKILEERQHPQENQSRLNDKLQQKEKPQIKVQQQQIEPPQPNKQQALQELFSLITDSQYWNTKHKGIKFAVPAGIEKLQIEASKVKDGRIDISEFVSNCTKIATEQLDKWKLSRDPVTKHLYQVFTIDLVGNRHALTGEHFLAVKKDHDTWKESKVRKFNLFRSNPPAETILHPQDKKNEPK